MLTKYSLNLFTMTDLSVTSALLILNEVTSGVLLFSTGCQFSAAVTRSG